MLTAIQGTYRNGKIELRRYPYNIRSETPVIVTFLDEDSIDLEKRNISPTMAAAWRAQLASFAEEWDSPEMDIYDNYDEAKASV